MPAFRRKRSKHKVADGVTAVVTSTLDARLEHLIEESAQQFEEEFKAFADDYQRDAPKDTGRLSKGFQGRQKVASKSEDEVSVETDNEAPYFNIIERGTSRRRPDGTAERSFNHSRNRFKRRMRRVASEVSG